MNRISSFEELKTLASSMLKPGVLTNASISKRDYLPSIEAGKLYYDQGPDYLYLYRQRDGFYICNFYVTNGKLDLNDGCIVEIAYRPKDTKLIDLISSLPYKKELERIRLTRDALSLESGEYTPASEKDLPLIKSSFDKYTGCIPTEEEIKLDYCISTDSGLIHYSLDGKTCDIRHMVVKEECRRQGKSNELLEKFNEVTAGLRASVWTNSNAAIAAYEKAGFKKDGRTSVVFSKGI